MWAIERTGQPHARVSGGPGDAESMLAEQIGLQADEANAWLTSRNDSQPKGYAGRIPNTLVFLWAGDLGRLGKLAVGWGREMAYARRLGFHVVELDFRDGRSDYEVVDVLAGCSQRGELHGIVVTGHGGPSGFGTGGITDKLYSNRWHFTYDELDDALCYHLGIVVLNACLSGFSRSDKVIRTARNFLVSRVDPDYQLEMGGRDLVANSPAARFFGQCGILYPLLEGGRVRRMLRPGEHGTVEC